jgi:hypothetical protein
MAKHSRPVTLTNVATHHQLQDQLHSRATQVKEKQNYQIFKPRKNVKKKKI